MIAPAAVGCKTLLAGLRHAVEEINHPSLQGILGTDDEESLFLDQLLEGVNPIFSWNLGGASLPE